MPGGITHGRISDPRLLTPVCAGLYMSPGNSVLSEDCKWNPHLPPREERLTGQAGKSGSEADGFASHFTSVLYVPPLPHPSPTFGATSGGQPNGERDRDRAPRS